MSIFEIFKKLLESIAGEPLKGPLALDIVWLVSAIFGFWLIVLVALSPFLVLKKIVGKK